MVSISLVLSQYAVALGPEAPTLYLFTWELLFAHKRQSSTATVPTQNPQPTIVAVPYQVAGVGKRGA